MNGVMENTQRDFGKRVGQRIKRWAGPLEGFGTVEVILILVVLIALVLIFKRQITELVEGIFQQINNSVNQVY